MNIAIGTAANRPMMGETNSKKQKRSSIIRLEGSLSFRLRKKTTSARTAKQEKTWSRSPKLNKDNGSHIKKGKPTNCPLNIIHRYATRDNVLTFDERDILEGGFNQI